MGTQLRRVFDGVRWYVNGLTGESKYDHYVAHARAHHPEIEPQSRRAWWRQYHDWQDANPQGRCC